MYKDRFAYSNQPSFGKLFDIYLDASDSSIKLGDHIQFRDFCQIRSERNGKLEIGNSVFFNNQCSIQCLSNIKIGNNNQFGEGVKLYDHNHLYKNMSQLISEQGYSLGSISIGNNCWIGSNVVILKDVNIGDNVVIGAGCIIYKSVPSNTVVVTHQTLEYNSF